MIQILFHSFKKFDEFWLSFKSFFVDQHAVPIMKKFCLIVNALINGQHTAQQIAE